MGATEKTCSKCHENKPLSSFSTSGTTRGGAAIYKAACNECRAAEKRKSPTDHDRQRRLDSDTEPLKPSDIGEYKAPEYDREKKQEYNAAMGSFAGKLREMGPPELAEFVSLTAEQERRWINKRLARAVSLGTARELLFVRQFEAMSGRISWPTTQKGYVTKEHNTDLKRIANLLLTDLHIGANLPGDENPQEFNFLCGGRRLAYIANEVAEFKTRYRDQTQLMIHLAGDLIEGWLGHASDWDNAPLPEQCNAAAFFLFNVINFLATAFPEVEVHCQVGNHGRDIHRHPGRATSSKHKSFETMIYVFLREQCKPLKNVKFFIPKAPWEVIPLFNKNMLLLHGDTEVKLKSPGASGGIESWRAALDKMNSELTYGAHIDLLAGGHFHFPLPMYFASGMALCNGALVPQNGFARAGAMGDGLCGQFLWESVENHAFGDSRFLDVGPKQDRDAGLDTICPQFVWVG